MIMNSKQLFLLFAGAVVLASCSSGPKSYTVTGTLPDDSFDGKTVYINNRDYNRQRIDTAVVSGSTFTFTGVADTASFCQVSAGRYNANFILENGEIVLDLSEPRKPAGTALNEEFARFFAVEDSLNTVLRSKFEELGLEDYEAYAVNEWKSAYISAMRSFFEKNLDNPVSIRALFNLIPLAESNSETIDNISMMSAQIQNTTFIQDIVKQIEAGENTAAGKMFADFSIETKDGGKVSLSDYVGKGNYVLVDFWASWCGPCRRETPVVAELYDKYKSKGLEVLGVAVWDRPKDTQKAIEELGITWPQILNAGDIPTKAYGINSIPHIILFGPDGTIIERDLRGDRMKEVVSALY